VIVSTPTLSSTSDTGAFSKEVQTPPQLMSRLDSLTIASSVFSHTSNFIFALHATPPNQTNLGLFQGPLIIRLVCPPCSNLIIKVKIAYGSLSPIFCKGSIPLMSSTSFSPVLHLSDFAANFYPLLVLPMI
jgi:hypothetical protein